MAYFKKITATGSIVTGQYKLHGMILGTDGSNDPTVTVEDRSTTKNAGEMIPTTTYDASALGLNGAMLPEPILCNYGIYVTISCAGTVEVTVLYS